MIRLTVPPPLNHRENRTMSQLAEDTRPPMTGDGLRVVQRTILRADQELDVRSLYLWAVTSLTGGDAVDTGEGDLVEVNSVDADQGIQGYGRIDDSGSAVVLPGRRISFGTYFNAFPASYWRRWTDRESVKLIARLRGEGTFIVYRSTSKGHVLRSESVAVSHATSEVVEIDLPLSPFIDGGWYWFDLEASEDTELVLEEAGWAFETDRTVAGHVTIGITTFNRPEFCVDQLLALGRGVAVHDILDEVIVVDQGTQRIEDHPDFAQAQELLGDRLRVITQPNLGGSGGFSRAMFETVASGRSDYVLLLDDDVVCELEGIARAVAFADLAKSPTLVGGQMFSLYDRTVMHAFGEAIAKWRWFWGPAPSTRHGHDFSKRSLRSTPWLHRRIDVDYNGWWMCLIPTQVIKEIGLSLPMFIKWDDAEFGLRAGAAGFTTVTLPGVAVWHVPWTEKDDTLDWQAYFHQRNRLVSGLLHSPYEHGGRLVRESLENHVKRLVSMQYSTGEIIMMAIQDVLDGPERMHRDLIKRLPEIRELRGQYDDAVLSKNLDAFPPPRMKKPRRKGKGVPNPTRLRGKVQLAATGLIRQVAPVRDLAPEHPEEIVPHVDQRWYRLAHYDSAIVSTADGTAASWYKRDRSQFLDQLSRSSKLHARLYREWDELAAQWRAALPELTSMESWQPTFEGKAQDEA